MRETNKRTPEAKACVGAVMMAHAALAVVAEQEHGVRLLAEMLRLKPIAGLEGVTRAIRREVDCAVALANADRAIAALNRARSDSPTPRPEARQP